MSGKGKEDVKCYQEDGESCRKRRTRREEVTEKGKEDQLCGREPDKDSGQKKVRYLPSGFVLHEMTPAEMDEHDNMVAESEGYDLEGCFFNSYVIGGIGPIIMTPSYRDLLHGMSKLALMEYNKEQGGTRLRLRNVVKANKGHAGDGLAFYITFNVGDLDDPDNHTTVFQARVVNLFPFKVKDDEGPFRVEQVRPKPPPAGAGGYRDSIHRA